MTMPTPKPHVAGDGSLTYKVQFRMGGRGSKNTSRTFASTRGANAFCKLIADVGVTRALEILDARVGADEGTPTVAQWCTRHIDAMSGNQADTLDKYRSYVRNDLGTLGAMPIDAVDDEMISAWVNEIAAKVWRGKPASGKTVANKHGFLYAAFERAVKKKMIPANPCADTTLPRTVKRPMTPLAVPEYLRFLDCFAPHWQPLVSLLFETGLRWSEATALQIGDLDLQDTDALGYPAPTLKVERAWKRSGKLGPPKTERARRTIALSPDMADVLAPLIKARPGDAWVFLNLRGGPVRHATFHDNVWQPAVRLANGEDAQALGAKRVARRRGADGKVLQPLDPPIGKRPRIHDSRHSCASWLLAQGVPPTDVTDHLGHDSFATTDKLYRHMMPSAPGRVRAALAMATAAAHPTIDLTPTADAPQIEAAPLPR